MHELYIFGLLVWVFMLLRLTGSLVSSDAFTLKASFAKRHKRRAHLPTISVLIPAYNEALTIERTLQSVRSSNYPAAKLEIIVINDGSNDATEQIVRIFKVAHKHGCKIRLINRPNKGKAGALNYALRRVAKGKIIMCLDADSTLHINALRLAAQYFRDRNVVALCTNVNVMEDGSILALAQRVEYLLGFHIKKGLTQLGVNYIIGGAGSMFRLSTIRRMGYYEGNTLTEDLDLTMKIISQKRLSERITYAADAITYTEAVHSLSALMQQRFRWMYGRSQVFYKYSHLFFSRKTRSIWRLTWFMLPLVLLQDLLFLALPVVVGYLTYNALRFGDTTTVVSGFFVTICYLSISIWSAEYLGRVQKLRLIFYAPPMCLLIYLTTFADYYALVKSLILARGINLSVTQRHIIWRSPARHQNSEVASL